MIEELQLGDRVIVNCIENDHEFTDALGKVVSTEQWYGIEFDEYNELYHDLVGRCEEGYGWWFNKKRLNDGIELYKEVDEGDGMKFKAGDMVRIKDYRGTEDGEEIAVPEMHEFIGCECEVYDVVGVRGYHIYTPDKNGVWYYRESMLEAIELEIKELHGFKVGDRVIVGNNEVGTLRIFDNDCTHVFIGIEFDEPKRYYHDLEGLCKDSYGYFFCESDLESEHIKHYTESAGVGEDAVLDTPVAPTPVAQTGDTITSYNFLGEPDYELLCREAFTDGIISFVMVENDKCSLFVSKVVLLSEYMLTGALLNTYSSTDHNVYIRIPFCKSITKHLLEISKAINNEESNKTMTMKSNARVDNDKSLKNKVIYFK